MQIKPTFAKRNWPAYYPTPDYTIRQNAFSPSIGFRSALRSLIYALRACAAKGESIRNPVGDSLYPENQPPRSKLSRYDMNVIISQQVAEN
jgi:hypothetical protein